VKRRPIVGEGWNGPGMNHRTAQEMKELLRNRNTLVWISPFLFLTADDYSCLRSRAGRPREHTLKWVFR
jgi:hypothetical protein